MKPLLIAEIGLCHNGSIDQFREMIRIAKESGADMVKSQAFEPADVKGSMPPQFYEDRKLSVVQCIEMILWARDNHDIELFFSIFSPSFDGIRSVQRWQKFAAKQSSNSPKLVEGADRMNTIASVSSMSQLPRLKMAKILYACPYLSENPRLEMIGFLSEWYGRQVGYSDHTVGIENCVAAQEKFGAHIIEKHFTLTRDIYFEGNLFRDCQHGATPSELEKLASRLKK